MVDGKDHVQQLNLVPAGARPPLYNFNYLYCTALYCSALYCTALFHIVLHCIVLLCIRDVTTSRISGFRPNSGGSSDLPEKRPEIRDKIDEVEREDEEASGVVCQHASLATYMAGTWSD